VRYEWRVAGQRIPDLGKERFDDLTLRLFAEQRRLGGTSAKLRSQRLHHLGNLHPFPGDCNPGIQVHRHGNWRFSNGNDNVDNQWDRNLLSVIVRSRLGRLLGILHSFRPVTGDSHGRLRRGLEQPRKLGQLLALRREGCHDQHSHLFAIPNRHWFAQHLHRQRLRRLTDWNDNVGEQRRRELLPCHYVYTLRRVMRRQLHPVVHHLPTDDYGNLLRGRQ
jgi:hypothetical protein